jgi:hypothetical protein
MKDAGWRNEVIGQLVSPLPGCLIFLAEPPERAPPERDDIVTERRKRSTVRLHGVVCNNWKKVLGTDSIEGKRLFEA